MRGCSYENTMIREEARMLKPGDRLREGQHTFWKVMAVTAQGAELWSAGWKSTRFVFWADPTWATWFSFTEVLKENLGGIDFWTPPEILLVYRVGEGPSWACGRLVFPLPGGSLGSGLRFLPGGCMVTLGSYKHFKGTEYTVMVIAKDSETQERVVIYTSGDTIYWVRSEKMFEEEVEWPDGVRRPRFVRQAGSATVVSQ